jgi:uncharacterized membrane protein
LPLQLRSLLVASGVLAAALACGPDDPNPIVVENALPGSPASEWQIAGSGDPSIQGFATEISAAAGETIAFKVDTDALDYRIDVYRLGFYAGLGARKLATLQPSAALPQAQPACLNEPVTGLIDCGNWAVSAAWEVPADAVSGIYLARLVREDPEDGRASHVIFVVRDDTRGSDLLFQTMDTTWQAYNDYGGNSLYEGSPAGRAYKVSYNRPFDSRAETPEDWVFNAEYPMLRWLEANGYDVSYTTGVDSDRRGDELLEHRVFLSVGHDEYWSAAQRANVEVARDAGVHLAFFSGNEVFWKTRFEPSIDGSGTPHRTLVAYKETHAGAKIDPDPAWTGTWRDPRFSPPADGGRPENELTGTIFTVNCCSYPLTVPAEDGRMRFWRNTSIASLLPGQVATLPADTLGYEWDEDLDNGFRPPGLVRLSTTTVSVPQRIVDFGSNYAPASATHHLVLQRRPSGALVFGAGTIQWAWGLDDAHDRGTPEPPDPRMQQATVNLLADMGVQPETLQPGLVPATVSGDATPPSSSIGAPAPGATLSGVISVSGSAADAGGGVVGGVEVSSDGGVTWHPASGRESWSWSFTPAATGPLTLRVRAVDDSGNLEAPGAGVTITASPRECPCSVWDDSVVPSGNLNENDGQPLELGMKFQSAEAGFITALRFYKSPSSSGVHSGRLWTAGGSPLAEVTFTGQTASGWQQQALPEPVAIAADTTYVVSYHSEGFYAFSQDYFTGAVDNPPLRALADGEDGPNAVYKYGAPGFPDQTYESSNYWVDVVFEPTLPGFRIFEDTDAPADPAATQGQPIEVGVKLRAQVAGSVTALRFYKGPAHAGTHVGHLWTAGGALLTSASFDAESASGWQEVALAAPVPLAAGTSYVVSYHSPSGHYGVTDGGLAAGKSAPPLELPADGVDGPNGVFRLGASGFPDQAGGGDLYFVDVVFVPDAPFDATPPSVVSTTPAAGATQVAIGTQVRAQLDEALDPASVGAASFELRDAGAAPVAASVTWDGPTLGAVLTPDAPLAHSTSYTATLRGGPGGVRDVAGNPLAADLVWSFTTGAVPPDEGSGGPILVVASSANPFGRYYAEILRNEGLTQFAVTDVAGVDAARLAQHEVVILAEMALTPAQTALFTGWVQDGGRLLAMRPDPQLAGLLGLGSSAGTLAEGYLAIDTSGPPGQGLVSETLQFHGTADLWNLAGASAVATLHSDAATATPHPAVTLASVGTQGGMAAAFSFDLARSVVYTRQGNPAFSGQERDGQPPIRSDDLYWPAYVDLDKVAIPQADEQQRLFAHLVQALAEPPLPRFWYFPRDLEAVVVMTGDEHGCCAGSTTRFAAQLAEDPPLCSPEDWECVRSTSYVYPSDALDDGDAAVWDALGFELAVHVNTGCADWTPGSLDGFFSGQRASFAGFFPSLPAPTTNRNHCIAWSDWASGAQVSLAHGVRLDTNYYYWPPAWVANRPGLFTGSGMPMRFADLDGSLIDVYQAATQMTDESGQAYPFTIDTLLDRALGPEGYYGAFVANMHTDAGNSSATAWSASIVASAQARGVPVISARQLLEWLDARNASRFEAIAWDGQTLGFTLVPDPAARNLVALLPLRSAGGDGLASLARDAQPVAWEVRVRKGVEYAVFPAETGAYTAQYQADVTPPAISGVTVTPGPDAASVTWSTDEPADSAVLLGTDPEALAPAASDPTLAGAHALELDGLAPATTYHYQVVSVDASGNAASEPPLASPPASFATLPLPSAVCFEDTSAADFAAGAPDAGLRVANAAGGELILAPALAADFDGGALPAGWSSTAWEAGGGAQVVGGALVVDGARAGTDATFAPGSSVEFSAAFGAAPFQHVGFGVTYETTPFAIFSTGGGGSQLLARSFGADSEETPLGAGLLGTPHRFRIDWTATAIEYRVDGALVASHTVAIGDAMRPLASDLAAGGPVLAVDWLWMPPHAAAGSFVSRVFDAATTTQWQEVTWSAGEPAGSTAALALRSGDTPTPDASWTAFAPLAAPGSAAGQVGRYAQYRVQLATPDAGQTPELRDVQLACQSEPGDADGDGIADPYETDTGVYGSPSDTGTDPLDPDSDADGARDGFELAAGTDPNAAGDVPGAGPLLLDLGTLAPAAATRAHALSGDGLVAAGTRSATTGAEAFRWTASAGLVSLGDLPGGARAGQARALSLDGATAVGVGGGVAGDEAFRWTAAGGLVSLGDLPGGAVESEASGVSADGSVVVGAGTSAAGREAFRWTAAGGLVSLGDLPGSAVESEASGVAADGSVVVGAGTTTAGREAFRWTATGGLAGLGDLAGGALDGRALGVSPDGATVAAEGSSAAGREAFLWIPGKGSQRLGDLPGGAVAGGARAASAAGRVVVGSGGGPAGEEAMVWTRGTGLRRLQDVLELDFGLDLSAWERLVSAEDVSDDGTRIAGFGLRGGVERAFVVRLTGACANGADDDGDLAADYGADAGCSSPIDPSELPDCADGLDDDGDGLTDFGADPSCSSAGPGARESTQCSNGIDDDDDGQTDHPGDTRCQSPRDDDERRNPACGMGGLDLVPLLALLAVARRRRRGP